MKLEAESWREERERVAARQARKSARATAFVRWFVRLPPPDHFVWHDVGELINPRSQS